VPATSPMSARPRLSRTLSRARWREYHELLESAIDSDYAIVSVESWLDGGGGGRTLILRHDVDQHPRSALIMASVERAFGVTSTWYFRWRTADPTVIAALRAADFGIGFHYETLSRVTLEAGRSEPPAEAQIERARETLRREIAAFARLYGPLASVTPHGDSRVPAVSNAALLRGENWSRYGVRYDANEAMRGRGLRYWLTDRSSADGGWVDGVVPRTLFDDDTGPILCLTHPNNWTSGASLWLDRCLRAILPSASRSPNARPRPIRTGSDQPPI
jgi:hypothetical protein